jgi:hypothetical protein
MWIDLCEFFALVLSSKVVDVILVEIGFDLIQSSQNLTRVDRAWVA